MCLLLFFTANRLGPAVRFFADCRHVGGAVEAIGAGLFIDGENLMDYVWADHTFPSSYELSACSYVMFLQHVSL